MNQLLIFDHYPFRNLALPHDWQQTSLAAIAKDVSSGFPCGNHNQSGRGIPHLRPMNIDREGRLDLNVVKFVECEPTHTLQTDDVLFNNTNSPELIGKTAAVGIDGNFAFSNHMTRIRLETGMDSRFIARQLHFLWMTGYFRHRCVNHVNQASFSAEPLLHTVPVLIAPAAEQQRISDAVDELLSDLDAGVLALEGMQKKLPHYRAAVLNAAVEGKLTFEWRAQCPSIEPASELLKRILTERRRQWEEEQLRNFAAEGKEPPKKWKEKYKEPIEPNISKLPVLPKNWCWANAEQLCSFITKGTTPPGDDKPQQYGEVPFIKVQHLSSTGGFHFSESPAFVSKTISEGFLSRSRVFPGDVLMNIVGPPLGQVSIVPAVFPEWNINQAIAIFRAITGLSNRYLSLCLRERSVLDRALKLAKTTAGQVNLTLEICRQLPIPLAPEKEQEAIVEAAEGQVSLVDHSENALEKKLSIVEALRQSILKHAFAGKLISQDLSDEPASDLLKRIAAEREERTRRVEGAKGARKNGFRMPGPTKVGA